MAYIINSRDEVVAIVSTELRGGTEVQYAQQSCAEEINADREVNLVNASWGKISHAAKWENKAVNALCGSEVNDGEFLIG